MRKLTLIFFSSETYDGTTVFEEAFRELGVDVETLRISYFDLSNIAIERERKTRQLIKDKLRNRFVIFNPGTRELFIDDAHFTLAFSAYSRWFDPTKVRVIPHMWTPVQEPEDVGHLRWHEKPPLRIGFMGSPYTRSRLTKLVMNSPRPVRDWFIAGNHLRYPELMAKLRDFKIPTLNINTFPRIETLNFLGAGSPTGDPELDIVERHGFSGTEEHMQEYKEHLAGATYVISPRGMENYSYRMYEALCFGRVPVIIDTDMVLPKEIDWDHLAVKVPYDSIGRIRQIIHEDYHSRSAGDFIARQELAFATMKNLKSMEWVRKIARDMLPLIDAHALQRTP